MQGGIPDDEFSDGNEMITEKGLEHLKTIMPQIDTAALAGSLNANDVIKLFTVSTQNDHARLAIDWAVALATGGKKPASTHFPSLVFEDSVTDKPNPVECKSNLPGDIYLSAKLSAATQAKLVKLQFEGTDSPDDLGRRLPARLTQARHGRRSALRDEGRQRAARRRCGQAGRPGCQPRPRWPRHACRWWRAGWRR